VPSEAKWVHVETLTSTMDCNANGVNDQCDLSDGTSEDCDSSGVPDECQPGGPYLAVLTTHSPAHNQSLWRSAHNVSEHTFSCTITAPQPEQLEIRELISSSTMGPDLWAQNPSRFSVTVVETVSGNGKFWRLKVWENDPASFVHRKWYTIRNVGAWETVQPFCVDYLVQKGDANGDKIVNSLDVSTINGIMTLFNVVDDHRADVNGDGHVNSLDLSAVYGFMTSFNNVPKKNLTCDE